MSEKNNEQNQVAEGKGGNNKVLIIIGAIIIILLVILIIILLLRGRNNDTAEQPEERRSVILNQENAAEIAEEMTSYERPEAGYYTVAMTIGWHFENGTAISYDAFVRNKEENSHDVYFDLYLSDDPSTPIYESPVISLGAELDQIQLNRELPKGEYPCVMYYHLVDKDQNTVDTLQVTQTVIIEN
jgi:hypothetical protein